MPAHPATGVARRLIWRGRARRTRLRVRRSLIAIPALYVVGAIALGLLAPAIDRDRGDSLRLDAGIDSAREILNSTATGMIAFTGLVIASVLVVVQFAAAQYSPRLILWFRRDLLVKHAIGSFIAAFLYALVALRTLERRATEYSPDVTVFVALVLLVGASVLFLALLQRVIDRLRPRSLYAAVGRDAIEAVRAVYPHQLDAAPHGARDRAGATETPTPTPRVVRLAGTAGVVTSFDRELLVAAAAGAGVAIELVVAVGEFVDPGEELLHVHGDDGGALTDELLLAGVAIGDERTIEQDPAFAVRIVVDTAIRALSPAVNDPTTAVHAIDQLEVIVRELAARDLDASFAHGDDGRVLLTWRAPSWDDVLDLAFDEIRAYGASSVQVCRRLRAALQDLRSRSAPVRHAGFDEHLARLDATIALTHPEGSPDRALAAVADPTGIGLRRPG